MTTEPFYDLAKYKLSNSQTNIVKCLDRDRQPYHPDVKDIWPEMTRDERGWYVLFCMADNRNDQEALRLISPSAEIYEAMYIKMYNKINAYNRDIVNFSSWDKWAEILKARQATQATTGRRTARLSAADVRTDFTSVERPSCPRPGTVRKRAGEDLGVYDEGWVRPEYWTKG